MLPYASLIWMRWENPPKQYHNFKQLTTMILIAPAAAAACPAAAKTPKLSVRNTWSKCWNRAQKRHLKYFLDKLLGYTEVIQISMFTCIRTPCRPAIHVGAIANSLASNETFMLYCDGVLHRTTVTRTLAAVFQARFDWHVVRASRIWSRSVAPWHDSGIRGVWSWASPRSAGTHGEKSGVFPYPW